MQEDLTQHKRRMLNHLTKERKRRSLASLLADDEDEEKLKSKKSFDIGTAPKFELEKEHLRKRIEATGMRTMAYAMDIARTREELIEKKLVEKQLAFLLIALRQKILSIPTSYARKLLHKESLSDVHTILREMVYRLLEEIKNLPIQVTDPNWLQTLEEEEETGSANREGKGETEGIDK
jgi:hypothetical protein